MSDAHAGDAPGRSTAEPAREPKDLKRRDRLFGPTLVLGLVGAALLAVAGHRDWLSFSTGAAQEGTLGIFLDAHPGLAQAPLAGAMGLVALAAWGALLVTRGRWRRAAALLGIIAPVAALGAWAQAAAEMQDKVADRVDSYGFGSDVALSWTPWFHLALVGAVLTLLASAVAVVRVTRWPAMGTRYDNPAARAEAEAQAASEDLTQMDPTDLWKALDRGQDPT